MKSKAKAATSKIVSSIGFTQKVESGLLNQMKNEFRVSKFYLSASYFFTDRHYHGISSYLRTEYQKETKHAFSISDYMTKRGTDLTSKIIDVESELGCDKTIKQEVLKWNEPVDIFASMLRLEQQNQLEINDLMALSQDEQDHATYEFLSELMKQQIECTHESEGMLAEVCAYSKVEGLLWHLDKQLR